MLMVSKDHWRTLTPHTVDALMGEWPASWAGFEEDKAPGRRLATELRPFIMNLINKGLTAKTIRRHLDNLWAIGGEIIRQFNDEPALRTRPARQLLLDVIDVGEAPILPNATEAEQLSVDATARKLLKFILSADMPRPS